ncbi:hypothetical protein RS3R6_08860 [Pseudomonas atacamensis]|uniref:DNA ligase (ATP) n=1 Tax=Pseudomonas atacamensis TaxID=2565368 RepID=A0ABQ5PMG6_9PSED|nr:hypothetical protein [Pseudomonas atacamensis]GLH44635.1 hypothetical protein RS3R1_37230 [Pseudomonas atacamensis]GLH52705.1 hypothetical protein RS3R6_08860 [Pseudomonas atacamensis]
MNRSEGFDGKCIHWLQPTLLAEVSFAEITSDGVVRHAVFQGIRTDKPAQDISGRSLRLRRRGESLPRRNWMTWLPRLRY